MKSTGPVLRTTSIEAKSGGRLTLVEIDVAKPQRSAVALVFDLSDSCRSMTREVEKLAKLLAPLPREWELWTYTLSNPASIHGADMHTLAHVHDGSIALTDLLAEGTRRRHVSACGSFLRPVIEAIERERAARHIGHVTTVVVTDGELTDGVPISVPPAIKVVGLGTQDSRHPTAWSHALEDRPFCTLSDPTLEQCLQSDVAPFFAHCRVEILGIPSANCPVRRSDVGSNSIQPWNDGEAFWNFIDGPLVLVFSAEPAELSAARICLSSSRSHRSVVLPMTSAVGDISPQSRRSAEKALENLGKSGSEILIDCDAQHANFFAIWKSFVEAATGAKTRSRWTNGALHVLVDATLQTPVAGHDARLKYDALLCFVNCEATLEPPAGARLVVVVLDKRSHPTFFWRSGTALSFAEVNTDIVVRYDRRESRWTLQLGTEPAEELEPRGSQRIERPLPVVGNVRWTMYFSGDLR